MSETNESLIEVAQPKKKFYQKTWGKILIGVVLAIGLLIFITMAATSGAVKVSDRFLNSMQASNASDAYALFSSEAKNNVDSGDFSNLVNQIGPVINTEEKTTGREVSSETGKNSTAKISYELTGTDNVKYTIIVELVKENDEWKVLNFDSSEAK